MLRWGPRPTVAGCPDEETFTPPLCDDGNPAPQGLDVQMSLLLHSTLLLMMETQHQQWLDVQMSRHSLHPYVMMVTQHQQRWMSSRPTSLHPYVMMVTQHQQWSDVQMSLPSLHPYVMMVTQHQTPEDVRRLARNLHVMRALGKENRVLGVCVSDRPPPTCPEEFPTHQGPNCLGPVPAEGCPEDGRSRPANNRQCQLTRSLANVHRLLEILRVHEVRVLMMLAHVSQVIGMTSYHEVLH